MSSVLLNKHRWNLLFSAYQDDDGKPWILPVVRKVVEKFPEDYFLKDHLPILGLESLRNAATKMLLGADNPAIIEKRVRCTFQIKSSHF